MCIRDRNQTILLEMQEDQEFIDDLEDILVSLREMMRCDVLDEPFTRETIIGLTHEELRAHSHNPMKYYKVKQMVLPLSLIHILIISVVVVSLKIHSRNSATVIPLISL